MSVTTLIEAFERRGVRLKLDEKSGQLLGSGALTPEVKEEIRNHKPEIIEALFRREADRLIDAMLRRISDMIPVDVETSDWAPLDAIEQEITAARESYDMRALRDSLARYETAVVTEITRRA